MRRLLAFLLVLAAAWGAETGQPFGWTLTEKLAASRPNLICSPYSLEQALALVYLGAEGDSAARIARVAGFPADPAALAQRQRELEQLAPDFVCANALFAGKTVQLKETYLQQASQILASRAQSLDFGRARAACEVINHWVSEQTHGRIERLLDPSDLDPATLAVLLNAVYLKATWLVPFDPKLTVDEPFLGSSRPVPMMHRQGNMLYGQTPEFQLLRLPYAGGRLVFDCVLPRQPGPRPIVPAWAALQLPELESRRVRLSLPRFRLESRLELLDLLTDMGFPAAPDLSRMVSGPVRISKIVQKAFIQVDEKGTEAAAATAVVVTRSAMVVQEPVEFRADHPFFYLIRDAKTGAVLFTGQVSDPNS